MKFLCKIGFHKWHDDKYQHTKNMAFGFSGCEQRGRRLVRHCIHCDKVSYMRLNLAMPSKFLYDEAIWQ
ncbi:hypothetical protein KAR91_55520 [Candidatus Pacearchaeota archaeon]|nr:hypothetical protein [Candidatus Pacearchaeota archaeon]